jgi:hypothetical protein
MIYCCLSAAKAAPGCAFYAIGAGPSWLVSLSLLSRLIEASGAQPEMPLQAEIKAWARKQNLPPSASRATRC